MIKTGIYVDAENIRLSGGYGMRYEILYEYGSQGNSEILRANSYVIEDRELTTHDEEVRAKLYRYHDILRGCGFKLIKKQIRRYTNANGETTVKANTDMDMAIDALLQARNLDRIILLTGDGDFCRLVTAVQNMGCRVEVIGFLNVSKALKEAADFFISGFLVPGLLPADAPPRTPGETPKTSSESERIYSDNGSILRGHPVSYKQDKGYGFFRYLERIEGDLIKREVYFHHSQLVEDYSSDLMCNPSNIFEFRLVPSTVKDGDLMAAEIRLLHTNVVL